MSQAELKRWMDYVGARPCLICQVWPVEVAHIAMLISPKTGLRLGRRIGVNKWAVIPLCVKHHRTGSQSIHNMGEKEFFAANNITQESLLRVWASWFCGWVEEGKKGGTNGR